jgi:uncharacterized membrane protein YedE/YeeE
MAPRAYAAVVGVVFGLTLCWVRFSDPSAIRRMLLFEDGYLWLVFAAAVGLSLVAVRLVRRFATNSIWTHEPIAWQSIKPQRNHIAGSVIFGIGWAISAACPGPVATQLGQGIGWSAFVMAGIVLGIKLHGRREPAGAPEPAPRPAPRRIGAAAAE